MAQKMPERQQHVTEADDVADDRDREGDDVAEQAAAAHELGDAAGPEDEVERVVGDGVLGEAGGGVGAGPDRHASAVDEDRQQC